ncbi:DNA-binding response regulator [Leptospira congkakensis]|uniref:DNA-binding response regulator n=1 Tax=Leptospira congkakensis TaxID=2484932 RepID=A0A4Z1A3F4_9LEPT|nr:response regulator transcription factor [Leptospira congkakensis]TGL88355.1 DNA-binding response regulator [Leptospira congkakensis]TGL95460.1 DNA-binding response regulator [Leptospira congkakensis]TGL96542.1 DNA-binding response regulator [Leptospira congkakensis]
MLLSFDCVDDDPKFTKELTIVLSSFSTRIRIFGSAEDYLTNLSEETSLLFFDIKLPGIDGIQLTQIVREKMRDPRIVVLSALDSDEVLFQALKAGAIGYILKSDLRKLPDMVEDLINGGAVITPTLALRVLKSFQEPRVNLKHGFEELTAREKEILQELVSGQSLKEVAEELEISTHTVSTHAKNIYRKLQVNNRIQLLKRAAELGLY